MKRRKYNIDLWIILVKENNTDEMYKPNCYKTFVRSFRDIVDAEVENSINKDT